MPIVVTIKEVRPNINTEFYNFSNDLTRYENIRYSTGWQMSSDDLSRVIEVTYNSDKDRLTVNSDPEVQETWKLKDDYNVANNIIVTKTVSII